MRGGLPSRVDDGLVIDVSEPGAVFGVAIGLGQGVEGVVILLPRAVRVYMATRPENLRESFDG
jgi:hypothetical protein